MDEGNIFYISHLFYHFQEQIGNVIRNINQKAATKVQKT